MIVPFGAAKRVQLAVLAALATVVVRAQSPVTVELHHRSAEAVITASRPLIAPATLTGAGTLLQVRAQPADLARVQRLIEQADQPLRPLAVDLRDDPPRAADADALARAGSVTLSTGRAQAPDSRGNGQVLSTGRGLAPDSHGNGQVLSTQSGSAPARIVEGDAFVLSMPATQSLWFRAHGVPGKEAMTGGKAPGAPPGPHPTGGPGAAGVVQFDAAADFTARIWLAGETVAIDLQPRPSGRLSGVADSSSDHATVYGRVGQWIALAESGTRSPEASAGAPAAGLWIKVEPAP